MLGTLPAMLEGVNVQHASDRDGDGQGAALSSEQQASVLRQYFGTEHFGMELDDKPASHEALQRPRRQRRSRVGTRTGPAGAVKLKEMWYKEGPRYTGPGSMPALRFTAQVSDPSPRLLALSCPVPGNFAAAQK